MIINATINDANEIARIHVEAWRAAYKGIVPDSYLLNLSIEKRTKNWHNALSKSTNGTMLALNQSDRIVGWVSFGSCRDDDGMGIGEINAIYLLPDHWGKKIGKELMIFAESELTNMGYKVITLWVLELNHRARRFYEKLGYKYDGTAKKHNFDGIVLDEYRYRKTAQQGDALEELRENEDS